MPLSDTADCATTATTSAVEPEGATDADEAANDDAAELDDYPDDDEGHVRLRAPVFTVGVTVVTVLLLGLLAANVYQYLHYRHSEQVATVNGVEITQREFNRSAGGSEQSMQSLIDQKLIQQEGQRQKVTVPNSEVDAQVDTIKRQLGSSQEFQAALQRANLTEPQLRDQIRTQLLAQRIGAKDVAVSDQEAQAFYDQNKAQFGQQTFDQVKDQVKRQLLQSKQTEAIQAWIASLRQKAKVSVHLPT